MDSKPVTPEQKKQALEEAVFDRKVISKLGIYDSLKNFLLTYRDTIITFRTQKMYNDALSNNNPDTILPLQDCYNFFQNSGNYDNESMPDFLKLKINGICSALGDSSLRSFQVCKDKKVSIEIKSISKENGLFVSHNLLWNTKPGKDYDYVDNKDTLLNRSCVYRIGLAEYHGY